MARVDPDAVTIGQVTAIPMRERGTREGRRYWRARTGKGPERRTVWAGWGTRDEVEAEVAALVTRGIPSPQPSPGAVRRVGDLLDRWASVQTDRLRAGEIAERTARVYRTQAGHLKGALGALPVEALSRPIVEDQIRSWRLDGVSPRSAKLAADILSSAVAWGVARGLCPAVDLAGLVVVDAEDHEYNARTPSRAEVSRVLAVLPAGRDRALIELLALTGARVGEVGALTVGSYDRPARTLRISGRDRARGRRGKVATRSWPVAGRLEDLLAELTDGRDATDPLIADLTVNVAELSRRVLVGACERARVEPFTAHGLRRLVATELLDDARGNAKAVARLTGHSPEVLLRSYIRPTDETLRAIVERTVGAQTPGTPVKRTGQTRTVDKINKSRAGER